MVHICCECGETYQAAGFCGRDGSELAPRGDDPLLGTVLGSWRVAQLIGTGGMGRVYKAVQPDIGGRVAIKVLNSQAAADDATVQRFFAEARAVNLIRHENIINVLDLSTMADGRPYIVMEYLDGAALSSIIDERGALPVGGYANVLLEILDALDAAHAKGIIHRDLKPANVFVTPGGHARLLDFGIAKLAPELDGRTSVTRTGSLLGTPQYMAPEQASAQPLDHRTDLYAVGVMMYEGLTGKVPFSAPSLFDLLRQHLEDAPRPPRELRGDIPPDLETVVLQALEKEPERRFASAGAMLEAVRGAVDGLPSEAWASIVRGADSVPVALPTTGAARSSSLPGPGADTPMVEPSRSEEPGRRGASAADTQDAGARTGWRHLAVIAAVAGALGLGAVAVLTGGGSSADDDGGVAPGNLGGAVAGAEPGDGGRVATTDSVDAPGPVSAPKSPSGDDAQGDAGVRGAGEGDTREALPVARGTESEPGDGGGPGAGGPNPNKAPSQAVRRRRRPRKREAASDQASASTAKRKAGTATAATPAMQFRQLPLDSIDATNFNAGAYLRKARKMAREYFPDARLTYAYIQNVKPNGRSDLTLGQAIVTFMFRSKKASVRGDLPRGVTMQCKVVVSVIPSSGITIAPTGDHNCADVILGMPKCSPGQLWDKAIAAGAPKNAVAALMYSRHQGQNRWIFTIASDFTQIFPDDC